MEIPELIIALKLKMKVKSEDIKEQERLREHVFKAFKESGLSIVSFSKNIGIPYGTLRRIMDGKEMGYKNILKLIHWWESR
jgi:predicted transcriptional regulator